MSAEDATTQCVPAVLKTARILDLVALGQRTDPGAPFLIRGEPGVGKDVLARLIHAASERQRYSFIKVNCAVRSADRCEVDLFGHGKGASPRAIRRRLGSFEFANHGTIYLDEIEALPRTLVPGSFACSGRERSCPPSVARSSGSMYASSHPPCMSRRQEILTTSGWISAASTWSKSGSLR